MIVCGEAIYEGGTLKLKKPLPLPENTPVSVLVKPPSATREDEAAWQSLVGRPLLETWEAPVGDDLDDAISKWRSPRMQEFFTAIRKVARTDAPVLILGESGTEREMAALAIHRQSARKDGPFVPVSCAGIPESLLAVELFGSEKRAFPGTSMRDKGRIADAVGGTLFLDEIGELPLVLQKRILGLFRDRNVEEPGVKKAVELDARVVSAANVDLAHAVKAGKFLENLYYHLAVVALSLPPLRERKADIVVLAQELLRKHALENQKRALRFSAEAVSAIESFHWPGNVRELENRIQRAVIMADGAFVTPADLQFKVPASGVPVRSLREAREALDRDLVEQALARYDGNIARAAADLGVSRPTFYELMAKFSIKRDQG